MVAVPELPDDPALYAAARRRRLLRGARLTDEDLAAPAIPGKTRARGLAAGGRPAAYLRSLEMQACGTASTGSACSASCS